MKAKTDGQIRYKKVGGGSLRMHRKIIKPGEIFYACPADVAKFGNAVVPLENIPKPATEVDDVKVIKTEYKVMPRGKSKLWFDVVGPNGKLLNEKALKKDVAEQLVKDLAR